MDMGSSSSTAATCKISMLWNWYTVDACFISSQWRIRTVGAYVGSLIALFALVILLEFFRRAAREYDRRITKAFKTANGSDNDISKALQGEGPVRAFRPTHAQQVVRSAFHTVQFGAGYMLMLLAMYYNGGVILVIFTSTFVGHFLASRDVSSAEEKHQKDVCC
ncbi:Ctr copper transporter [Mucidula mucida]|nr:Ctr copper transporter [Mucidula mucida]